jgi:hypothetical protein
VYPRRSRDDIYFDLFDKLDGREGPRLERLGDAAAPRLVQSVLSEAHVFAAEI